MAAGTNGSAERSNDQQRLASLEAENAALKAQLVQRDGRIADLERQVEECLATIKTLSEKVASLSKNSGNSSKPPSSDIVKPPRPRLARGPRRIGGQPGHPGTCRSPVPADQVDRIIEHHPTRCPRHGEPLNLTSTGEPRIQQVIELKERPIEVIEHRCFGHACRVDGEIIYASLPDGVIEGPVLGPRLMSMIGYMKGGLHSTYSGLEDFSRDVLGVDLSRALLCNTVARVSEALRPAYEQLRDHVPTEPVLHVDETGWKDNGKKHWLWIFATGAISVFVLAKSRSSRVLHEVLGTVYGGTLVSDFYSAYVGYANGLQQYCLAHLIRDVKFLTELPDPAERAFGQMLLTQFRRLFHFWHLRQTIPKDRFNRLMQKIRHRILVLADRPDLPRQSARLAKRIGKHDMALFRFLFDPAVEPTNNTAERAIRHSVLDQRLTQGSRSDKGRRWTERIFTVLDTCRKQNRSAWKFIQAALSAHYFHTPMPSLIPQHR